MTLLDRIIAPGCALLALLTVSAAAMGATRHAPVTIRGRPLYGHTLRVAGGGRVRGADHLAYRWLLCDRHGRHCHPLPHARRAHFRIGRRSIGRRIRVTVIAVGRHQRLRRSAPTDTIPRPAAVPARFRYLPASPMPRAPLHLVADRCGAAPCTYRWTVQAEGRVTHPPGRRRTTVTFSAPGPATITLTTIDALRRRSRAHAPITVAPAPTGGGGPPAPTTTTSTATVTASSTTTATTRSTTTTTKTATTTTRTTTATPTPTTATTATTVTTSTTPTSPAQTEHCYATPTACGYPSASSVGAGNCSALTTLNTSSPPAGTVYQASANELEVLSAGVTIANTNLGSTSLYVGADNFTLSHSCMTYNGQDSDQTTAVEDDSSTTGMRILNSSIAGANATTESAGALVSTAPDSQLSGDLFQNTSDAVGLSNGSTLSDSYVLVNATPSGAHDEDVYYDNASVTITDSTLLNTQYQTAVVFGDTTGAAGGACINHLTLTDNLLAGGGMVIYPCGNASAVGSSTMNISDNDFARCLGTITYQSSTGGHTCGSVNFAGADSNGIWPYGGYFGLMEFAYCPPDSGQNFSGNRWDDNGATVSCTSS